MMRRATFVEQPTAEDLAAARGIMIGLCAATIFWALVAIALTIGTVVTR